MVAAHAITPHERTPPPRSSGFLDQTTDTVSSLSEHAITAVASGNRWAELLVEAKAEGVLQRSRHYDHDANSRTPNQTS
jgi:hypothetical protein